MARGGGRGEQRARVETVDELEANVEIYGGEGCDLSQDMG